MVNKRSNLCCTKTKIHFLPRFGGAGAGGSAPRFPFPLEGGSFGVEGGGAGEAFALALPAGAFGAVLALGCFSCFTANLIVSNNGFGMLSWFWACKRSSFEGLTSCGCRCSMLQQSWARAGPFEKKIGRKVLVKSNWGPNICLAEFRSVRKSFWFLSVQVWFFWIDPPMIRKYYLPMTDRLLNKDFQQSFGLLKPLTTPELYFVLICSSRATIFLVCSVTFSNNLGDFSKDQWMMKEFGRNILHMYWKKITLKSGTWIA